jgi:hypothetical protein
MARKRKGKSSKTYKMSEIEGLLRSKFEFEDSKSSSTNHTSLRLKILGVPVITVQIPRHKKDLRRGLEGRIARELYVRIGDFRDMMDCDCDKDQYYELLRTNPYPPFPDFLSR